MNILVTGGAGYVGSVCAEILITRGHAVFVFDNLSVGYRRAVPQSAVFFEGDLADRQALDRLFAAHQIEAVMHFAAFALVEESVQKPSAYYVNNVANSIQLLDAMVRRGVKKLIFSSSAAIYGEPKIAPIPEEHQAAPINPYGHTKLTFERILEDCGAATGLQYACLRYFNAAGATRERGEDHRPETHLIPLLLQVALGQRPNLPINGTDYPTHWTSWNTSPAMSSTSAAIEATRCARRSKPHDASPATPSPSWKPAGAQGTQQFWWPARRRQNASWDGGLSSPTSPPSSNPPGPGSRSFRSVTEKIARRRRSATRFHKRSPGSEGSGFFQRDQGQPANLWPRMRWPFNKSSLVPHK